jgi:hypothetical protein
LSAKRAWLWVAERGVGLGAHSQAGCVAPPCRAGAGSTPRTPTRPAPPARTRPCGCRGAFAPPRGPAGRWPPPAVPAGVAAVKKLTRLKNSWAGCRVESALHCTHARTHHTHTHTPHSHRNTNNPQQDSCGHRRTSFWTSSSRPCCLRRASASLLRCASRVRSPSVLRTQRHGIGWPWPVVGCTATHSSAVRVNFAHVPSCRMLPSFFTMSTACHTVVGESATCSVLGAAAAQARRQWRASKQHAKAGSGLCCLPQD